jgi:glycosyltransferase involved in cell wall biosynthesis
LGQPSPANIVISEPDGGIYQAMNKAIGLCSGEYIQFLNAGDELFDSDTLAQAIPFLDGKSEIVIFGYSMHGKTYVPDISLKGMLGGMPCHQAIFYQREMLRHYPFDGGFRYCADFQHLLCAIFMQKIDLVDLVVVRYDTSGLTSDKSVMRKIRHERAKSALASDIPTAWKTSIALYNFIREVI